jgi:tetratricopeptide (TPR) repeat protein
VSQHLDRGRQLIDIGRPRDAEEHIRKALSEEPENFRAHMMLALVCLRTARYDEAIPLAERAIALDPTSDWPHRFLSHAHADRPRPDRKKSLAYAFKAAELEPDVAANHMALSEAYRRLGRKHRDAAVASAQRSVALDPDDSDSHLTLGNAYRSAKQGAAAEQAYRKALEVDPESSIARSNLAALLTETGRATEALPLRRSNVMDAPGDNENMDSLLETADAYLKDGPTTKLMNKMFKWSLLRLPLLIALILFPFAKLEQRRRVASLPADVQAARASRRVAEKREGFDFRLVLIVIGMVAAVLLMSRLM